MLIPDSVLQLLVDAGVTVVAQQPDEHGGGVGLVVAVPRRGPRSLEVKRFSRPVGPALLARLAQRRTVGAGGLLVITPSASRKVRELAVDLGVSLVALNNDRISGPNGHLAFGPGDAAPLGPAHLMPRPSPPMPGRRSWGTSSILRMLLLEGSRTQREIAGLIGVSQPRVSQVLSKLTSDQLVERVQPALPESSGSGRWRVRNWDGLLSRWLDHYPGPGGVTTFWYSLDVPNLQVTTVVNYLAPEQRHAEPRQTRSENASILISGDVAADILAPWARPQRAVIYARQGVDLADLGMTPSPAQHATLALVVPEDPGVWTLAGAAWHRDRDQFGFPLADPLQILWDVRGSPGPDADQATTHFVAWLRERFGPRSVGGYDDRARA